VTATETLRLADGRDLEYLVAGPDGGDSGDTLVFHHGTPSGVTAFAPLVDAAADRGYRTIFYARPGYGASTAQPGRSVASCAADVSALLDHLDVDSFVTIGWSGGGPHALACSALLRERCRGAALIAGVAPYTATDLDFMAGMGEENLVEFGLAIDGEAALMPFLLEVHEQIANITPDDVAASLGDLISDVDRSAIEGGFATYLAAALRAGMASGVDGWRDDDLAFVRDWAFDLAAIGPTAIWQGDQDRMVPYAHGEWLAANLPGTRSHLLAGEGHLSVAVGAIERIVADLADLAAGA
jgi:pimeloyl-ACP methyl ester carboxylesterase